MDIKKLISEMTLEEKAGMCSGADFWHLKGVERLGIPSIMVTDGPHGVRKQDLNADHLGINNSIEAVCFPSACTTACSYDEELIKQMGEALGDECQAESVAVLLGPGVNIKRSPLCGRNFEYFSEDPLLSSKMASSHIKGLQSKNIGASLKHFFANNQEHRRMTVSVEVDERTMHEIYFASFETAVKEGKPWTVMSSYNKINNVYASENHWSLTEILRGKWGFDGMVVSDWGGTNDRVMGLFSGNELEMPSSGGFNDKKIVEAVQNGSLDELVLDTAVERILSLIFRFVENRAENAVYEKEKHHELARKIAAESMVLLKNDNLLPLAKDSKVAFIGKFAKKPRYQGGGSSHINAFKEESALDAAEGKLPNVSYAQGYDTITDVLTDALLKEAVETAKNADVAVIFAGLPDAFESEGFDRTHINMPTCQNALIQEICKVQKNVVVVLHNGSPIAMPWIDDVSAVLEVYLGGQAVGGATVDVLFGDVNPSGKLAETFPLKLEDNPSYLNFPGEDDLVMYREGIFVGYRYYDKKAMDVLFPFGHGLSYTTFEYSDIKCDKSNLNDNEEVCVSVKVKNTGARAGKEIVQLYVRDKESVVIRPEKELKGFKKIELAPGEEKEVTFKLDFRSFAYYNTQIHDWHVETGEFEILIGKSSRVIEQSTTVFVSSTTKLPKTYTMNSTFGDLFANDKAKEILSSYLGSSVFAPPETDSNAMGEATAAMMEGIFKGMPVRAAVPFSQGKLTSEQLQGILDKINQCYTGGN